MPRVFTIDGPALTCINCPPTFLGRSPVELLGGRGHWGQTDAERDQAFVRNAAITGGLLLAAFVGFEILWGRRTASAPVQGASSRGRRRRRRAKKRRRR
jgi:hypothetical protein